MSTGTRQATAIAAGAIPPRSLMGLHQQIKARLQVVAAKFPLLQTETAPGETILQRAPVVLDGWLPPKRAAADPTADPAVQAMAGKQFPFMLVRPVSGVDTWEGSDQTSNATFKIIIGTWSDDDDGWLDIMLIVDAIRDDLAGAPTIQGTGFEHNGPIAWELSEEQPRPQWLGVVTTIWTLPRMRRVDNLFPELTQEI